MSDGDKEYIIMHYYFHDGGEVEIYSTDDKVAKLRFIGEVRNGDKEWFSRICVNVNGFLREGSKPQDIYFKITVEGEHKRIVVTNTHYKPENNFMKYCVDTLGNLYYSKNKKFKLMYASPDLDALVKQLDDIVKNYDEAEMETIEL